MIELSFLNWLVKTRDIDISKKQLHSKIMLWPNM